VEIIRVVQGCGWPVQPGDPTHIYILESVQVWTRSGLVWETIYDFKGYTMIYDEMIREMVMKIMKIDLDFIVIKQASNNDYFTYNIKYPNVMNFTNNTNSKSILNLPLSCENFLFNTSGINCWGLRISTSLISTSRYCWNQVSLSQRSSLQRKIESSAWQHWCSNCWHTN
jgi:hypothetical protein